MSVKSLVTSSIARKFFYNRQEVSDVLADTDYVFHLVSSTNPATAAGDPFIDLDTNVRSTIELLELCVEHKVKRVIFPSSGGTVYGDVRSDAISEKTLPEPRSPYGIGKLTIEHYLRYFKHAHGLDYLVYRIANPYGPGQSIHGKQGVIPIFISHVLANEPVTVYGDGEMVRDYIYIDDLISMITASYDQDCQHQVYNLGSGRGTSVNELIRAIEACSGQPIERKTLDTPPTFVAKSVLDTSRYTDEFHVTPSVNLEDGIRKTWEYVQQSQ
jgi:UDP-glucose 4-epimerase